MRGALQRKACQSLTISTQAHDERLQRKALLYPDDSQTNAAKRLLKFQDAVRASERRLPEVIAMMADAYT